MFTAGFERSMFELMHGFLDLVAMIRPDAHLLDPEIQLYSKQRELRASRINDGYGQ